MFVRFAGFPVLCVLLIGACGSDTSSGGSRADTGSARPALPGANDGAAGSGMGSPTLAGVDNPTGPAGGGGSGLVMPPPMRENSCGRTDITASRILPSVMLLVDGSTSMDMLYGDPPMQDPNAVMPAPQPPSRWQAIRKALVDPDNGVVPKLEGLVRFGLAVYGTMPQCPLPLGTIEPKLDNFQAIQAGLPGAPPGYTTPTGVALDQIADMLPDPKNNLDTTIGPQIIILATDGDPNSCDAPLFGLPPTDYGPSIQAAMKVRSKNQRMYVISVGQDAATQHLQEMANLGADMDQLASPGATVYYPEDPASLAATLETLIGDELSCDLALDGKGVKLGSECMGEVTLNGVELECNGADGWKLTDTTTLTLQGAACDTYKNASDAMLRANFPCDLLVE